MLNKLVDWSISKKMLVGISLISFIGIVVGIAGLISLSSVDTVLNRITDESAPTVETADDLVANIWEATKVAEEIIADEEISDIKELEKELATLSDRFRATYTELQGLVTDPELADEMAGVIKEHREFDQNSKAMIVAHLTELEEKANAVRQLNEFDEIGGKLITLLDEFANENEEEMQRAENEGDRLVSSGRATAAQVNNILGSLFETDYPAVEAALKMQRLVMEMQDTAGEYLASDTLDDLPEIQQQFNALAESIRPHLSTLKRLAESDEDKDDARVLEETFENWYSTADDDERLFDTHKDMLIAEKKADDLTEAFEKDADTVAATLNSVADVADAISDSADEEAATVVTISFVITVILLLSLLGIAFTIIKMVQKMISEPIHSMNGAMLALADGDTNIEVPEQNRKDEIGQMASAVQVFKQNAIERIRLEAEQAEQEERTRQAEEEARHQEEERKRQEVEEEEERRIQRHKEMLALADSFEETVLTVVDSVSVSVTEMIKVSQEMASIALNTSSKSSDVAAIAEESSRNVNAMAASAEEMAASIREIANNTEQASLLSTGAVGDTDKASGEVENLVEFSSRVSNVVNLINDIAEQTNLLALNATIEAARSGEAGKGFAVVASEVKNLAKETAKATEEIGEQVRAMQSVASKARDGMTNVRKSIDNIHSTVSAISGAITQQDASTQEIARSAQEVSAGTEDVASNISEVNNGATTTGSSAEEVVASLSNISVQTQNLRQEVVRFIENIRTQ